MLHDTKYIDHHLRVSIQHAPTDLTREIQEKRDEVRNLVSKAVQKKRELYALGKADKNCETLGEHHMLPLALPYLSRQKVVPKPHGTLRYVKIIRDSNKMHADTKSLCLFFLNFLFV